MTSKESKAKRRAIPTFTIAELEEAGRLEEGFYLVDSTEKYLMAEQRKNRETAEGRKRQNNYN